MAMCVGLQKVGWKRLMVVLARPRPVAPVTLTLRVLYIGHEAEELRGLLRSHLARGSFAHAETMEDGVMLASDGPRDVVIIDHREASLATKLVGSLLSCLEESARLVVVSPFDNLTAYLKIPASARVVASPLRLPRLLRAMGLH